MNTSFRPRGIYSAQWIPVDATGRIDRGTLAAHLEFERQHGIAGVLALGSTGEFPHFSIDERKHVLATVAELAAPLPVIANISDIRPRAAIELGRFAKSLGLAAVGLMPPPFYPMSQPDVLAFFLHVAESVDLPVMLYNFPELAGKRIDLGTVAAFADRLPMCAIKQSGGEFEYHRQLIQLGREKGYVVMSGADTRLPEVFALGAAGCIGGLVNIVPELMVQIYDACAGGSGAPGTTKPGAERPAHLVAADRMAEIGRVIDQLTFPPNVAAGLVARGFSPGASKSILSPESQRLYAKVTAELSALFTQWELAPATAAVA